MNIQFKLQKNRAFASISFCKKENSYILERWDGIYFFTSIVKEREVLNLFDNFISKGYKEIPFLNKEV